MPVLGLGTWELTDDTAGTVEEALRLGYRLLDTACDYGSQQGIGEALQRTDVPREQIFLVTKLEEDDDPQEAMRRDLGELGVDYADLTLLHRPPPEGAGEHLWEQLLQIREQGLACDVGVSNYGVDELEELAAATGEIPVVNQVEWTPFGWSPELLEYCREREIALQGYSPLTRAERLGDERLVELAEVCGGTPAQLLLRWALEQRVVPLPKANRREHLVENLGAFELALGERQLEELAELNEHYSALGARPAYVS